MRILLSHVRGRGLLHRNSIQQFLCLQNSGSRFRLYGSSSNKPQQQGSTSTSTTTGIPEDDGDLVGGYHHHHIDAAGVNVNVQGDSGAQQRRSSAAASSRHSVLEKEGGKDVTWIDKVMYSSYLEKYIPPQGYRRRMAEKFELKQVMQQEIVGRSAILPPVSVKYLLREEEEEEEEAAAAGTSSKGGSGGGKSERSADCMEEGGGGDNNNQDSESIVQFPYKFSKRTEFTEDEQGRRMISSDDGDDDGDGEAQLGNVGRKEEDRESGNKPDDTREIKLKSVADKLRSHSIDLGSVLEEPPSVADMFDDAVKACMSEAGTPDPRVAPSNVPCGGCGALLHCQDVSTPGYISSEIFKGARKADLMGEVCYRCSVLEVHQASLNVNVTPEDYPRIVGKIKESYAMVVLMVDLTDFPCSIWPGILDVIGQRRPIILVGNKVDLLPRDSKDYLKRVEESLIKCAVDIGMIEANIVHTALISAKTGYGVENLISSIFSLWRARGDVFIMGCTNVGKSSLFNMLLASDLCKPQAADLVQRATISQWPGTTLNLLKFPMTAPHGWRKELRRRRLEAERPVLQAEAAERQQQFLMTGEAEHAVLTGHVGKTFLSQQKLDAVEGAVRVKDIFHVNPFSSKRAPTTRSPGQWNPDDPAFTGGHWVYDTPGAVSTNQILDLLTLPELMQALPKTLIQPRTFFIKPGMSFFVGGLARVDFAEGQFPMRYTLFSNTEVPVAMTRVEDADEVYRKALGTKVLGIPSGSTDRLAQFPSLLSRSGEFEGEGHNYSCVDIVVSSVGWIAVTAGRHNKFRVSIHTPDGKGIFIRKPALLPLAVNWKGKRIRGTYSYMPHKISINKKVL